MNAANNSGDMNDYLYATNTDPSRNGRADTLFVLDGVTGSAFRFDPPPNVATFSNAISLPNMNLILATATNRIAGRCGVRGIRHGSH